MVLQTLVTSGKFGKKRTNAGSMKRKELSLFLLSPQFLESIILTNLTLILMHDGWYALYL